MMKYFYILITAFVLFSCTKEQDPENLHEVLYVGHKRAEMPVHMRGNINSGVVILIVHGGPGGNGLEYRYAGWYKDVEEQYAIAYWDQRGQGMSQGHYDKSVMTVDQMVEDMVAVLDVLQAKYGEDIRVFALGHSWGGTLTSKFMTTGNLQQRLNGWIECDGAHDMPKNNIEAVKMFIDLSNEQIALGNSTDYWQERLDWATKIDTNNISEDESLELNYYAHESEGYLQNDEVLHSYEFEEGMSEYFFGPTNPLTSSITGIQTNIKLGDEVEAFTVTDELHKISIPVLILWGKYDLVVPPTLGYDTYNMISSETKSMVIFEQSGHSPMINEAQKFADELILFVRANI